MATITATRQTAICCIFTAAVVVGCSTAAEAQARSRADLEFGGWVLAGEPGFLMGATGWVNNHSGVVVRGFVVPGFSITKGGNFRGFETLYHYRRFVGDFEINLGAGLMYLTGQASAVAWSPTVPRDRWSGWFPRTDILVGRRLLERLGVKAGLGTRTGGDFSDHIVQFTVVVPLGEQ